MNRRRIVGLFGDPGGAGAAAPVLKRLQGCDAVDLELYAYRQATGLFKDQGLSFNTVEETVSHEEIGRLLTSLSPALLFAGTSVNGVNLERKFTVIARQLQIPSLAVLDFWSNYRMRFSDDQGHLQAVPDKIAIMDERAKTEMVQEGFAADSLVVTGQPALDDLVHYGESFTDTRRREIRAMLGVTGDELLVVFASQPLSDLYSGASDPRYPGYDENTVMPLFFSALERIAGSSKRPICVVIRPHPREQAAKFDRYKSNLFRTMVSTVGDGRDVCLASELVTGMTSMLIMFACYLGCTTLSLQPGLSKTDPLPTTQSGETRAVYKASELEVVLREMLQSVASVVNGAATKPKRRDSGATENLLRLIRSMAGVD